MKGDPEAVDTGLERGNLGFKQKGQGLNLPNNCGQEDYPPPAQELRKRDLVVAGY